MARTRNIKPGFFKNDLLAELDPLARILFAGLWTIADRRGVIEFRPKRIKAEVLPYDSVEIEELLNDLSNARFIQFFDVGVARYIWIPTFSSHQNPHRNEGDSGLPEPPEVLGQHAFSSPPPEVLEPHTPEPPEVLGQRVVSSDELPEKQVDSEVRVLDECARVIDESAPEKTRTTRSPPLNLKPSTLNLKPMDVRARDSENGKQKRTTSKFQQPTIEEVSAYCRDRKTTVDPEKFWNYYQSNGWRVGRNPMRDWKAAVRNWERNEPPARFAAASKGRDDDDCEIR